MKEGILSTIGGTPLVRLGRIFEDSGLLVFAKLESLNPGGSIKDRAALFILKSAIERGQVKPGTTVIESSSGNMGIGLAQACAYWGLHLLCVVDPKTTPQNLDILRAYGAEIDLVKEPDPTTGEFLQARLSRVQTLLRAIEDSYWPDQYSNIDNAIAHHQTMREIVMELDRKIDFLFCATSTCGTLRGCSEYLQEIGLPTRIWAVDAIGSVIFGGKASKRLIPGHGAAVRPQLCRPDIIHGWIKVSDLDCVVGCRRLVRKEAILAGGSSGATLMALEQMKNRMPDGSTCVLIFPDRGERYVDTIYSDSWVKTHFGEVAHLWEQDQPAGRADL